MAEAILFMVKIFGINSTTVNILQEFPGRFFIDSTYIFFLNKFFSECLRACPALECLVVRIVAHSIAKFSFLFSPRGILASGKDNFQAKEMERRSSFCAKTQRFPFTPPTRIISLINCILYNSFPVLIFSFLLNFYPPNPQKFFVKRGCVAIFYRLAWQRCVKLESIVFESSMG